MLRWHLTISWPIRFHAWCVREALLHLRLRRLPVLITWYGSENLDNILWYHLKLNMFLFLINLFNCSISCTTAVRLLDSMELAAGTIRFSINYQYCALEATRACRLLVNTLRLLRNSHLSYKFNLLFCRSRYFNIFQDNIKIHVVTSKRERKFYTQQIPSILFECDSFSSSFPFWNDLRQFWRIFFNWNVNVAY